MGKPSRYFEIYDDVYIEGRWHLINPVDQYGIDVRAVFKRETPAKVAAPIKLGHSNAVARGTIPLDYTVISGDRVPVASRRVADILEDLAPEDVELIPAEPDGFSEPYFIVNVLKARQCIDEAACEEIEKFTEKDRELFPDKIGRYRRVWGLKIDKSKVQNSKVFWTWGWGALIVDEDIKNAFEVERVNGVKFVEV